MKKLSEILESTYKGINSPFHIALIKAGYSHEKNSGVRGTEKRISKYHHGLPLESMDHIRKGLENHGYTNELITFDRHGEGGREEWDHSSGSHQVELKSSNRGGHDFIHRFDPYRGHK